MIGQQIQNYIIISQLGQGGMGTVYKAVDNVLGREVALKMLNTLMINQPQVLERFKKEAQVLARLLHPNIAVIYNLIEQGDQHFMVMEYVEGKNLDELLRQHRPLPYQLVTLVFMQALEGLQHAHKKGIYHRDIKPSNLILTPDGTVKLMDFGIARVAGEQRMTQVNRVIGTVEFLAPEIIEGKEPSVASDIYATGVTMYELLSGKLPFESTTDYSLMQEILKKKPVLLDKINPAVPKALSNIVMKALEKKPENRFADAGSFQQAMAAAFPELKGTDLSLLNTQLTAVAATPATRVIAQPGNGETMLATRMESITKPNNIIRDVKEKYLSTNRSRIIAASVLLLFILLLGFTMFSGKKDVKGTAATDQKKDTVEQYRNPTGDGKQDDRGGGGIAVIPPKKDNNVDIVIPDKPAQNDNPVKDKNDPIKKEQDRKEQEKRDQLRLEQERKEQEKRDQELKDKEKKENPPPPPPRVSKTIVVKSGARVKIRLADNISSVDNLSEGQTLHFVVTESVVYDGEIIIRQGAPVSGSINGIGRVLIEFSINSIESAGGKRINIDRVTVRKGKKAFPEKDVYTISLARGTTVSL